MGEVKKCSKCKEEKSRLDFPKQTKNADGLHAWCRPCHRLAAAESRRKNPERAQAASRKHKQKKRSEQPDQIREYDRAYYHRRMLDPSVRDKERQRLRAYYHSNPKHVYALKVKSFKKYKANNLEAYLESRRKYNRVAYLRNPDKHRISTAKSRAARVSAPGEFTTQDISSLFKTQEGKCFYCNKRVGRNIAAWEVDHFVPISRGGSNFPDNLRLACKECNRRKHATLPWIWMPERFSPPEAQAAD